MNHFRTATGTDTDTGAHRPRRPGRRTTAVALATTASVLVLVAAPVAAWAATPPRPHGPAGAAGPTETGPYSYGYTGAPVTVTVPQGVQAVTFQATGGSGGNGTLGETGGTGAVTTGTFYVTPGEQIDLSVGQAGGPGQAGWGDAAPGGGPGAALWSTSTDQRVNAGGGGGATSISTTQLITTAGGGGGAGAAGLVSSTDSTTRGGNGGNGGAPTTAGTGGSSSPKCNGGAAGVVGGSVTLAGAGGDAGITTAQGVNGPGGGGGGGAPFGGGGGSVGPTSTNAAGGGGGAAGDSVIAPAVFQSSQQTAPTRGDGSIQLYYLTTLTLDLAPVATPQVASTTPVPLALTATDTEEPGVTLPDPTGFITWSSSEPTDRFDGDSVVMTQAGDRTITASWTGDPALNTSAAVQINAGPPTTLGFVDTASSVTAGSTTTLEVGGYDALGNYRGDATPDATYTSDVATDVFSTSDPNEVTMTATGPHVLTAAYPGLTSATITITVVPAGLGAQPNPPSGPPPHGATTVDDNPQTVAVAVDDTADSQLASTGTSGVFTLSLIGAAAVALGGVALSWGRRRSHT